MFSPAFVLVIVPPSSVPVASLENPVVVAVVVSGSHVLPWSFRAWTLWGWVVDSDTTPVNASPVHLSHGCVGVLYMFKFDESEAPWLPTRVGDQVHTFNRAIHSEFVFQVSLWSSVAESEDADVSVPVMGESLPGLWPASTSCPSADRVFVTPRKWRASPSLPISGTVTPPPPRRRLTSPLLFVPFAAPGAGSGTRSWSRHGLFF